MIRFSTLRLSTASRESPGIIPITLRETSSRQPIRGRFVAFGQEAGADVGKSISSFKSASFSRSKSTPISSQAACPGMEIVF